MTCIYQKPKKVEYSLPYSDGSGDRLSVIYEEIQEEIEIKAVEEIFVKKEDMEWLIEVLQDIKRLHEATIEKLNT